jgi:hypothetical protein
MLMPFSSIDAPDGRCSVVCGIKPVSPPMDLLLRRAIGSFVRSDAVRFFRSSKTPKLISFRFSDVTLHCAFWCRLPRALVRLVDRVLRNNQHQRDPLKSRSAALFRGFGVSGRVLEFRIV